MREILMGLHHWRVIWPDIWSLESYYLETESGGVVIDPLESASDVRAVIITSGWHERSGRLFSRRTGAPLYVPEKDLCMFEDLDVYETYGDGDVLPGGIRAIGCPGLTRGEQALFSEINGGTLFTADCLGTTAKWAPHDMILGGHPNGHPTPADTLSHILDYDFVNLCPGHGDPLLGNGKQEVVALFESGRSTSPAPPRVTYFPLDKDIEPSGVFQ
jgi:hypothetical protein